METEPARGEREDVVNGAAQAAYLAAGIGSFAMGLVVILAELDIFSAPAIYRPAGGVSGRTTIAVVLWLVAWAVLHARWKKRRIDPGRVSAITVMLVVLGVLLTFPPLWGVL
jgi:hypothetical protein